MTDGLARTVAANVSSNGAIRNERSATSFARYQRGATRFNFTRLTIETPIQKPMSAPLMLPFSGSNRIDAMSATEIAGSTRKMRFFRSNKINLCGKSSTCSGPRCSGPRLRSRRHPTVGVGSPGGAEGKNVAQTRPVATVSRRQVQVTVGS
jgi:hypothetical protein